MEIIKAQEKVDKYIQNFGGYWSELSMLARLVEEVGELSRSMNIKYGDKKSKYDGDGRELEKELADVLFTVLAIANKTEVNAGKVLLNKIGEQSQRDEGIYAK
jgi:NTP pyrophosphatase (non-canonical NTP hydrolase)